ncbi:MAG: hypothetical protein ABI388_04895 [Bacteroidia bacterium]
MATCPNFDVQFAGITPDLIIKMQQEVTGKGGTFQCDSLVGNISISVQGIETIVESYIINQQSITLSIIDKPFLTPCSVIQTQITKMIEVF